MRSLKLTTPLFLEVTHPTTIDDLIEMFRLRAKEYRRKGYILAESDVDHYDLEGKCKYFIAKIEGKIVGTVRLVIDTPLPTERYFDFQEPSQMLSIPKDQRAEISRLIVAGGEMNLLILWNLIKAIVKFGEDFNLRGGYAFIKRGLSRIIQSIGIPFHCIESFTMRYEEDLLEGYFHRGAPVIPIYYLREEVAEVMEKIEKQNFLEFSSEC